MKFPINTLLLTTLVAAAGVHAQAATMPHSNTLRVETPASRPVLAQKNAEAIYLHKTGDGSALLYVETQDGRELSVLNVTDPARVQRIAQTSIPTDSAFDFVRDIDDDAALIRYRDNSGFALLNFKHDRHPVLLSAAALAQARGTEPLGQTGLLVTVAENTPITAGDPKTYKVLNTANVSAPGLLATIPAVTQRVENTDTGTLFLLNNDGITMVRRLRVEEEHQIELVQERGN